MAIVDFEAELRRQIEMAERHSSQDARINSLELEVAELEAEVERLRRELATERAKPSASEALFMFAGWLTTRDETVQAGAKHDAAVWAELIAEFCKANGLDDPRDGWEQTLLYPAAKKEVK